MISYWAVLSAQFRALLQYRAAAIAGLGTQVFWGLIRVMIFQAFFRSTTAEQPMEVGDVLTYVWLSQAFLALLPWNQDNDLRALIRTGGVGYELLRTCGPVRILVLPVSGISHRADGVESGAADRVRGCVHGHGRSSVVGRSRGVRGIDDRRYPAEQRDHDAVQHHHDVDYLRRRSVRARAGHRRIPVRVAGADSAVP